MFMIYEAPVANSVINFLNRNYELRSPTESVINYILLWIAFNNIYTLLAKQDGLVSEVTKDNDGFIKVNQVGNIEIPKIKPIGERKQIKNAYKAFSDELKHELIIHESTSFFVYRTPKWEGQEIKYDRKGQRVNGVINVGYTNSIEYLVWSPIEINKYKQYMNNKTNDSLREDLSKQILFVLYAIRNNTFHGSKRMDDANDLKVVEKALPLLSLIVNSFFPYDNLYH